MTWRAIVGSGVVLGLLGPCTTAVGQERPFLFSFTPTPASASGVLVHYDAGYADRALPQVEADGLEQRLGLEARVGSRWTLLAASMVADEAGASRVGYRGEALFDLRPGAERTLRLSVGGGARREVSGVNVLLGRAVVGLERSRWRLLGNLLLEKPFEDERDAVDLITCLGFGWKLKPAVALGVEVVGEDLEGLWDKEEAEGGAKVFFGPVVHWALPSRHLQVTVGGGPVLTVRPTDLTSTAERPLGTGGRNGYAVRASVAYRF
jgi:hypothetical protein